MGIVIVGHAGLIKPAPAFDRGTGVVALDPKTTLQFYTDTGQKLAARPVDLDNFDGLEAPWPPLDDGHVTYNFTLEPLSQAELSTTGWRGRRQIAGHDVVLIGHHPDFPGGTKLCTGSADTCPTDPRMLTSTDGTPTRHTCDGVLARYSGQDLVWIACTGLASLREDETQVDFTEDEREAVAAAIGESAYHVLLGIDPDDFVANESAEYKEAGAAAYLRGVWSDRLGRRQRLLEHEQLKDLYK